MADDNTQEVKPKYPARLDMADMPRDNGRALGSLRQALCASFNYCRKYPAKMETLRIVIAYVLERIDALNEDKVAAAKALLEQAKANLEAEGKELGIDLDRRKSLENTLSK